MSAAAIAADKHFLAQQVVNDSYGGCVTDAKFVFGRVSVTTAPCHV